MHPGARLLLLIIIIGFVVAGGWLELSVGFVLLVGFYSFARLFPGKQLLRMVMRLRWLFLSIFILYGWLTPGRTVLVSLGRFSPGIEGLIQASQRSLVLVLIIGWVYWLTQTTNRAQMIQALYWLTAPLSWFDTRLRQVFAVRLALVMETVPRLQHQVDQQQADEDLAVTDNDGPLTLFSRIERIVDRGMARLTLALTAADNSKPVEIEVETDESLAGRDWLILITVACCLGLLTQV